MVTDNKKISFCRICSGGCGVILTMDGNDRVAAVRGDPDSALSNGYACFKGLQAAETHYGPSRLLHPLKRQPDGSYARIGLEQALSEIAVRIDRIIERDGPDAMAIFLGNGGMFNVAGYHMHKGFLKAFGSDQYFSTLTIDQSGKYVTFGRLGGWAAGYPDLDEMEVALMIGTNPLIAHSTPGFLQNDPVKRLKQIRAKGTKLIVIDPRLSETARQADLYLQPYPGQDAAICGALIRLILAEGWEDKQFCDQYVDPKQMDALRQAVEPFTTEFVESLAGLEDGQIRAVAQLFARDSKVGSVTTATGMLMSPFSNLAHHLSECINVICGRYLRAGQTVRRINGMGPNPPEFYAEVIPPNRGWEVDGPSRIRGTRLLYGERTSGTLADEILTPGKGQIRALFVDGGDPLTSLPNQQKSAEAMADLELLVTIDPWPSLTSGIADYVLPPFMQYERADLPLLVPNIAVWPDGWAQFTPPVARAPEGSDLVDDWYVFWAIAKQLGKTIVYNDACALDMEVKPNTEELLEIVLEGAPITLDELKKHPHGIMLDGGQTVNPPRPDATGRFEPMPEDVAKELHNFLATVGTPGKFTRGGKAFTHLLSTRRMRDLFNSNGRFVRTVRKRTPYNPAYLNPEDMRSMELAKGDMVELVSAAGKVVAIVEEDSGVKRGVVSIAHGWGGLPGSDGNPNTTGSAVNALTDDDANFEPINAMPHFGAIPVDIIPLRARHDKNNESIFT